MNQVTDLINDIRNVYSFLNGAHLACENETASNTFHIACHKLEEILSKLKLEEYRVTYVQEFMSSVHDT